jgi:NADP-dependent alcohol dehydrogenase
MENFVYHCPTRLVFGKEVLPQIAGLIPESARVLLTYGGGSIFRNGVHARTLAALPGRKVIEFGGIPPNPVYERLMEAVRIARAERVDFLLAVGGGSVLDGTKFIAAAIPWKGSDPWEIVAGGAEVPLAVPLGCVLTLPATGSEMNPFAVISRKSTQEKLAFQSPLLYPRFSVLEPETTFSLPQKQVRNGIVDAFIHVMEQYATHSASAPLQARQAEAVLSTLIEEGPKALERPDDYAARANLVWCATQALNGLIGCGVPQDWATHMIGHELTAFWGIDHAESLAIVLPSLLANRRVRKGARLAQYARRVWGLDTGDEQTIALGAIDRTRSFFESLGMPTRLAAHGISAAEAAKRVSERLGARGSRLGEYGDIGPSEVAEILLAS